MEVKKVRSSVYLISRRDDTHEHVYSDFIEACSQADCIERFKKHICKSTSNIIAITQIENFKSFCNSDLEYQLWLREGFTIANMEKWENKEI